MEQIDMLPEDEAEYRTECVTIDRTNLQAECLRLPGDLAYWGERYATAVEALSVAKSTAETAYASAFVALDAGVDGRTGKPMSMDRVKYNAKLDEGYATAERAVGAAERERASCWQLVEAIKAKQNMLQELGATARREMSVTGQYGDQA